MQVRAYDHSLPQPALIKGMLVPCAALPPNTIVVTLSMVKAPGLAALKQLLQPTSLPGLPQLEVLWEVAVPAAVPPHIPSPAAAAAAQRQRRGMRPMQTSSPSAASLSTGGSGTMHGAGGVAAAAGSASTAQGMHLEVVNSGFGASQGRLNRALLMLLDHWGAPRGLVHE